MYSYIDSYFYIDFIWCSAMTVRGKGERIGERKRRENW